MKKLLIRRICESLVVMLLVALFAFAIIYFAPGDISASYISPGMSEEQIAVIRERYHADMSLGEQFLEWSKGILKGDFGISLDSRRSVIEEIGERMPATMLLMGTSLCCSIILAIPLGLIAGFYKNKMPDKLISGLGYIGMSFPQFWLALVLVIIFASKLKWFPLSGMRTVGIHSAWDIAKHMVLPCAALCITNIVPYVRYIRAGVIHELNEEYVLTAKARGCSSIKILYKHVLKNSILPVITLIGMNLSGIVGGSFVIEKVFGWPGIGTYAYNAIVSRDYPVIMAYTLIVGLVLVMGNLIADFLYVVADPRIRKGMDTKYE